MTFPVQQMLTEYWDREIDPALNRMFFDDFGGIDRRNDNDVDIRPISVRYTISEGVIPTISDAVKAEVLAEFGQTITDALVGSNPTIIGHYDTTGTSPSAFYSPDNGGIEIIWAAFARARKFYGSEWAIVSPLIFKLLQVGAAKIGFVTLSSTGASSLRLGGMLGDIDIYANEYAGDDVPVIFGREGAFTVTGSNRAIEENRDPNFEDGELAIFRILSNIRVAANPTMVALMTINTGVMREPRLDGRN